MSELKEHLFCECDEIFREYRGQLSNEKRPYYLKSEADKVIAEKDREIDSLKATVKDTRELLLVSQKMHKRCADNAVKQIRRLKRALYKACANWALSTLAWLDCIDQGEPGNWAEMQRKCLKMSEKFKEAK